MSWAELVRPELGQPSLLTLGSLVHQLKVSDR